MKKKLITGREWAFVGVMVLLAVIFTNKWWILFLNQLNPLWGFLIYYVIVYSALALMSWMGLVVFGVKVKKPLQILGSGLILFGFFLIFNWTSGWVSYVSTGSTTSVPQVFMGSEDGVVFWLWSLIITSTTPVAMFFKWILAFPITVLIVELLGVLMVEHKPRLSA